MFTLPLVEDPAAFRGEPLESSPPAFSIFTIHCLSIVLDTLPSFSHTQPEKLHTLSTVLTLWKYDGSVKGKTIYSVI